MRELIALIILMVIAFSNWGCITKAPLTSQDYMNTCKIACKGKVQHYQDDLVDCVCKND